MFYLFFKSFKAEQFQIRSLNTLGLFLFIEQLLSGAIHKYPFGEPRTSLFFAPIVFYLTIQGILALSSFHKYLSRAVLCGFVIFLVIVSLGLARNIFSLGDLGAQSPIWR